MTVPAGNLVDWDRKLTSFGTLNIRSLSQLYQLGRRKTNGPSPSEESTTYSMEQSCRSSPFLSPRICSLLTSGIKAGDTRTGPEVVY